MTNKEAKLLTIAAASNSQIRDVIGLQLAKFQINGEKMSENNKVMMIDWLRRMFGQVTLFDFSNAFNLAITGRLDLEDANPYNNFSIEFVGRVLSSFIRYKKASGVLQTSFDSQRRFRPTDKPSDITPLADLFPEYQQLFKRNKRNENE